MNSVVSDAAARCSGLSPSKVSCGTAILAAGRCAGLLRFVWAAAGGPGRSWWPSPSRSSTKRAAGAVQLRPHAFERSASPPIPVSSDSMGTLGLQMSCRRHRRCAGAAGGSSRKHASAMSNFINYKYKHVKKFGEVHKQVRLGM